MISIALFYILQTTIIPNPAKYQLMQQFQAGWENRSITWRNHTKAFQGTEMWRPAPESNRNVSGLRHFQLQNDGVGVRINNIPYTDPDSAKYAWRNNKSRLRLRIIWSTGQQGHSEVPKLCWPEKDNINNIDSGSPVMVMYGENSKTNNNNNLTNKKKVWNRSAEKMLKQNKDTKP